MTARPSGVVLKYVWPAGRDVERAGLQRGDPLGDERGAAIDEPRAFRAVGSRAARDLVVVRLVGLAEVRRVRVRNRALRAHPVQRRARVETAGKRDADFLADGKILQDVRHEGTLRAVRNRVILAESSPAGSDLDARRAIAMSHYVEIASLRRPRRNRHLRREALHPRRANACAGCRGVRLQARSPGSTRTAPTPTTLAAAVRTLSDRRAARRTRGRRRRTAAGSEHRDADGGRPDVPARRSRADGAGRRASRSPTHEWRCVAAARRRTSRSATAATRSAGFADDGDAARSRSAAARRSRRPRSRSARAPTVR